MTEITDLKVLEEARAKWGNKNQILVCMEELNELGCVLAKYPRYDDEAQAVEVLKEKALDEISDVYIILEHAKAIFELPDGVIQSHCEEKVARLKRWLDNTDGSSMQQTINDREVPKCSTCMWEKPKSAYEYSYHCCPCMQAQSTEGRYINYKQRG